MTPPTRDEFSKMHDILYENILPSVARIEAVTKINTWLIGLILVAVLGGAVWAIQQVSEIKNELRNPWAIEVCDVER